MKAIRTIVNRNKGFFSFWLLLSFISAATARNIAPVFLDSQDIQKTENLKPGKHDISASTDDSLFGSLSPKDPDVDDVEFNYYYNYNTKNQVVLPAKEHDFAVLSEHSSRYNIHLYDLYCNWKLHLA